MPKLVFVSHEAADGRHSRAKKALIHAHTLQHNRRKSKRLPPSSTAEPQLFKDLSDRTASGDKRLDVVVPEEDPETDDRIKLERCSPRSREFALLIPLDNFGAHWHDHIRPKRRGCSEYRSMVLP